MSLRLAYVTIPNSAKESRTRWKGNSYRFCIITFWPVVLHSTIGNKIYERSIAKSSIVVFNFLDRCRFWDELIRLITVNVKKSRLVEVWWREGRKKGHRDRARFRSGSESIVGCMRKKKDLEVRESVFIVWTDRFADSRGASRFRYPQGKQLISVLSDSL